MKKKISVFLIICLLFCNSGFVYSARMSTFENLKNVGDEFITRLAAAGATEDAIEAFLNDMDATIGSFKEGIYMSDIDVYFITILLQNMQLEENLSVLIAFDSAYQEEIRYMGMYRKVPASMNNFKITVFADKLIIDVPSVDAEDRNENNYNEEENYEEKAPDKIIPEIVLPFDDIASVPWCVESVLYLYEKGVISGTGERTFEPNKPILREEFIKMIVTATLEVNEYYFNEYGLSAKGKWFHPYLATAEFYSLTQGIYDYDVEVFESDVSITRQDMTAIAYRAIRRGEIELKDVKYSTDFMDLKDISYYAVEAIKELQEANIIEGTGNNMFKPYDSTTRAEAAKIVYSIMKLKDIEK